MKMNKLLVLYSINGKDGKKLVEGVDYDIPDIELPEFVKSASLMIETKLPREVLDKVKEEILKDGGDVYFPKAVEDFYKKAVNKNSHTLEVIISNKYWSTKEREVYIPILRIFEDQRPKIVFSASKKKGW